MKKQIVTTAMIMALCVMLTACGGNNTQSSSAASATAQEQNEAMQNSTGEVEPEAGISSSTTETAVDHTAGQLPVTLTIGDTVLHAYLYDTEPARSLAAQLPMTVSLNDSDNDFCGDNIAIAYDEADVESGYQNGELAFWTPANNFVIFVSGEETSSGTGDLVKLGMITEPQEMLDALTGSIDVTIALDATEQEVSEMRVNITVGDTTLTATLEDNATTRAFIGQMPMTLPMSDLYGREMCYRYGAGGLPTDELRTDGYEVGDIAYWPPRGSLVILYGQNGEQFERQHLGSIDSGVEIFATTGDTEVTFELAD